MDNSVLSSAPVCQIAIVGGGMVGAVTALLLSRYLSHVHIKLFDRLNGGFDSTASVRPSFDGRSTAMAPTTQTCFDSLGLWQSLLPFATPIHSIHVSDKGHAGQGLFDEHDNAQEPLGFVVQNAGLGPVLMKALSDAENIETLESHVHSVKITAKGANLSFGDEGMRCFDLVIVADGANSRLRQQLGIATTVDDYKQHALVANVRHTKAHHLAAYERFTSRGPIALLPIGRHANSQESTLVWTCPDAELAEYQAMSEAARLKRLQQYFGFRLGYFKAMSAPTFYPLRRIIAKEQVRSHIVLMGNAAHFLHPVAGQGFNLSVRDALRLVAVLRNAQQEGKSIYCLDVLSEYERQQAADQRNTLGLSHGFHQVFTGAPLPVQLGRTLGLLGLEFNPVLRSEFIALLSGRGEPAAIL